MVKWFRVNYAHYDCPVDDKITWSDVWDCPCNGQCPACHMDDIEPISWEEFKPHV